MDTAYRHDVTHALFAKAPALVLDLRYIETEEVRPGSGLVSLHALLDSGFGNLHLTYDPKMPPTELADILLAALRSYREACLRNVKAAEPLAVPFQWPPPPANPSPGQLRLA